MLQLDVTFDPVKGDAGEGCSHLQAGKAGSFRGCFAGFKNQGADTAACPRWIDKEGANFGGIAAGVE